MTRGTKWILFATIVIGMTVGLGLFTFGYAKGYSYLTNDPAACANCHIMQEHFAAWTKGSHRSVATCNDCHTPHNLAGKYYVKAKNGFWHSFYFTVGGFPDPLRITSGNASVTQEACRYCHTEITDAIDHGVGKASYTPTGPNAPSTVAVSAQSAEPIDCVRCHRYVGHAVR